MSLAGLLYGQVRREEGVRLTIEPNQMYNNAFWARVYTRGFDCDVWVPQMPGYSGIVVALFPNGTTTYYASDGRQFNWDAALYEAAKIAPMCP